MGSKIKLAILIVVLLTAVTGLAYLGLFWMATGFAMMGGGAIALLFWFFGRLLPLIRSCGAITLVAGVILSTISISDSLVSNLVVLTLWAGAIVRTIVSWSRVRLISSQSHG